MSQTHTAIKCCSECCDAKLAKSVNRNFISCQPLLSHSSLVHFTAHSYHLSSPASDYGLLLLLLLCVSIDLCLKLFSTNENRPIKRLLSAIFHTILAISFIERVTIADRLTIVSKLMCYFKNPFGQ